MAEPESQGGTPSSGHGVFATTRWTLVASARDGDSPAAAAALDQLCRLYWYPLYAFVRRQGHTPHDAQDLTQEFFARLLKGRAFDEVNPTKGRFRSFLLASLKHFLANDWDRRQTRKRGGGHLHFSIDAPFAEALYLTEAAETKTAETIYERRWALTLLEQVLNLLRAEAITAGKVEQFDQLKVALTVERGSIPYAELAARLGQTEGAIKVTIHRLRQRYRELLRAEIAHTVADPRDVDDEIRHLFAVLAGR